MLGGGGVEKPSGLGSDEGKQKNTPPQEMHLSFLVGATHTSRNVPDTVGSVPPARTPTATTEEEDFIKKDNRVWEQSLDNIAP